MNDLIEAVLAGAPASELARCPVPATYRAAHLLRSDAAMFSDIDDAGDKDVRKSLRLGEVPMPELAPDEVLIAVMAAGLNYNTVWSAIFEPVPTFAFLSRVGRQGRWGARHDLPYHVVGSDAAGVIVRVGEGVRRWSVGQAVVVHPAYIDHEDPAAHDDSISAEEPLAWGFETNFGALADFAVAKASQLLPMPAHLTWEEAACVTLCAGTAYRMLVSGRGAAMKQGDVVLVWGATGGLGGYAVQLVRNGGGIAVGVVGSAEKEQLARDLGCAGVINREDLAADGGLAGIKGWRRLGEEVRRLAGEDPRIVFEHSGQETFGASVYVARRGGTVVTCGSSSGYEHQYDNRHLWMKVKRIVGSHGANYHEAWEMNRLVARGMLVPTLCRTYPLAEVGEAVRALQQGASIGKTSVLCLAPSEGSGVADPAARERVGEARLRLVRDRSHALEPIDRLHGRSGFSGLPCAMRAHRFGNSMVNSMRRAAEKDTLWRGVPPEIAAQMRPGVDRLVEEIVGAIKLGVPEYSRPLDDAYMAVIRRGVSQAVGQFVERVADPTVSRGETVELFRRIGRMEAAEGRTLEPLQAALRIGARVAWNRLYETATRTGMDLAAFARVGEAIFLHLDEIVAACAEGFAQAKAEVVGELERRRRRLFDLLIADPPVSHDVIVELARDAGWRLPGKVAAVVLEDKGGQAFPSLPSLPPDVLADMSRRQPCLLVPDPDGPGRAQVIRNGLRSWRAAVGPAVPLDLAASSLRWASHALTLAQRGVLHWDGGVVWCAACMTQLLVFSDEELLLRFAAGLLKPMDELNPAQRDRLAETLLAWLQNWGNSIAAARSLQVHPQTVRYRLRQVNELFADDLQDPDTRFALEIALRARQVLG